ncbi:aldehyde dehydrogenase family protein [Lacinutrix neustonica]|uniref:aldehyde dehydrogenase family protein n=1 Tax=Lacinutrix neustonica TaxID=2980107 RepID=UPI0028BD3AB7|nr:aldehyde dehydrogenase family protein [Lacinutrix neustonica]
MNNSITTKNPYNGALLEKYLMHSEDKIDSILEVSETVFNDWKHVSLKKRTKLLRNLGDVLNNNIERYSKLMTEEMGKPITQSRAEIKKCIKLCDFYEANAERFLSDRLIETGAYETFISYDPLGPVLAIMPWNYPFRKYFVLLCPH